jgi:hypothetical protein
VSGRGEASQLEDKCQYYYANWLADSQLDTGLRLLIWKIRSRVRSYVWSVAFIGFRAFLLRMLRSTRTGGRIFKRRPTSNSKRATESLGLKPGEWVEVKSVKEIFATFDRHGKVKGLGFMPEMAEYCGRRFRVYKVLEKIILESTGDLRKIQTPTVLLEGVLCDGRYHRGCDRSCFCFWREEWLSRAIPNSGSH